MTRRRRAGASRRGWTLGRASAAVAILAVVAVFLNDRDLLVDGRFEHLWAPGEFLRQQTRLWDDSGTLGGATPFFAPFQAGVLYGVRALGGSAAIAGRLLHAVLLAAAGVGTVHLLALYRRHVGPEHVLAGALAMLAPYAGLYLVPSALFVSYAAAPWLAVAAVRGLRGPHLWGWAAIPALAAWCAGTLNLAAFVYAAVPALIVGSAELLTRRATLRRALAFAGASALLTLLVALPAVAQLVASRDAIEANLATTERPQVVSRTSSWAESLRGAGLWIFYRRDDRSGLLARPEARVLLTNPFVITATFLLPALALAGLAVVRSRTRLLFGSMMLAGAVLMVGAHRSVAWAPLAAVFDRAFDGSIVLLGFRTSFKAGGALALGVAVLAALAVVDGGRRLLARGQRRLAIAGAVSVAAVLLGATHLFWSGAIYDDSISLSHVPGRWREAAAWLDAQPGEGRVLVLPGTVRARYEFGYAGDDILDGMLERPVVEAGFDPAGTAETADLIEALDRVVTTSNLEPGMVGPVLRRLGIRFVVARHDLAPSRQLPKPVDLEALHRDPDLVPVASFGTVHRNQRDVPAIEVFEVRDFPGVARLAPLAPELLVSGNGDAWPRLAERGLLDRFGAVRYTASLTPAQLRAAFSRGAWLVVTDTNRRRSVRLTSERRHVSHTLSEGQSLDRPIRALFEVPGAESVARHGDAIRILTSRVEGRFRGGEQLKPGLAVDGDLASAWVVGGAPAEGRNTLTFVLAEPRPVHSIRIVQLENTEDRITGLAVRIDGGPARTFPVASRDDVIPVGEQSARIVEVSIASVDEPPGLVGIAELTIDGVALDDRVRVPTDVAWRATQDRRLAGALAATPVMFQFEPERSFGGRLQERDVRRDIMLPVPRSFVLRGALRVGEATPEEVRAALDALDADRTCRRDVVAIDGRPWPVRLVPTNDGTSLRSCRALRLEAGEHRIDTLEGVRAALVWLALTTEPRLPERVTAPGTVTVLERGTTSVRLLVDASRPATLVTGSSAAPRWTSRDPQVVAALPADTQAAWSVPAGRRELVVAYSPQRWYAVALVISVAGVLACVGLLTRAARDRRRRAPVQGVRRRPAARRGHVVVGATLLLCLAVAGPLGAAVALPAAMLARRTPRAVALAAAVLVALLALLTLAEAPLSPDGRGIPNFVADRPLADVFGQAAVAVALAALAAMIAGVPTKVAPRRDQ